MKINEIIENFKEETNKAEIKLFSALYKAGYKRLFIHCGPSVLDK